MTRKNELRTHRNWVMDIAYIRDGDLIYTDESVILACLLHAKGSGPGRGKDDLEDVQRIMKDKNLDNKRKR